MTCTYQLQVNGKYNDIKQTINIKRGIILEQHYHCNHSSAFESMDQSLAYCTCIQNSFIFQQIGIGYRNMAVIKAA